jgi:hypothetical protein
MAGCPVKFCGGVNGINATSRAMARVGPPGKDQALLIDSGHPCPFAPNPQHG